MTGIKRAEIPFREVDQAVHAYKTASADGVFHVDPAMIQAIAEQVGFDQRAVQYPWESGRAWDRFATQIKRALDKMASATGGQLLRKAGAGSTGPDGREVYRNEVRWYTPAAWDRVAAETAARRAAEQDAEARWGTTLYRLGKLGILGSERNGWVMMDLDEWGRLLDLAEGGMARHLASGDA